MFGRRLLYWLPALCWASMIFYMSTQTIHRVPWWWFENADKVIHFILFGTLSVFVFFALRFGHGIGFLAAALIAVLASSAYGGSDEIHQLYTAGRTSDLHDWFADTLGACTVFLFAFIPQRKPPPAIVPYGLRRM